MTIYCLILLLESTEYNIFIVLSWVSNVKVITESFEVVTFDYYGWNFYDIALLFMSKQCYVDCYYEHVLGFNRPNQMGATRL